MQDKGKTIITVFPNPGHDTRNALIYLLKSVVPEVNIFHYFKALSY